MNEWIFEIEKDKGVCWAALNDAAPIIVPDVQAFPGHISCDSRSKSEITLPLINRSGEVVAVFDVDSDRVASFNQVDQFALTNILQLIYREF